MAAVRGGEEEFLRPWRRGVWPLSPHHLQKALREWATNPGLFSQPVPAVPVSSIPLFKISETQGPGKEHEQWAWQPGGKGGQCPQF